MNQSRVLILLVRVGIACLGIATLLFIILPTTLNSLSDTFTLRQVLISQIENYPGYSRDWVSVASLITVSVYLYCYLAITLVTASLLRQFNAGIFHGAEGRGQWNLLSYVIVGRADSELQISRSADYRSIASVIRDYSKSREGIGSVVLDMVSVIAVSYIGYTSLQELPSHGGLVVRVIDAAMIWLWCHCIFSILMWFIFVLTAWFQSLRHGV
ncbi:hypothetical protein [Gallionella capsiferriformans]|uniref:Uncharacterized protein n=1 Tax=Gallionella capsiferriformans (strain ES-2) TaxID=395494 RepID=D9SG14_GALCS|nr:hypothetical protein [Gallionella capsiferriformans]ADL55461.1 hypothetical protein Galf_1441 [Gallionella capsiferriformans ES-2]